MATNPTMRMVWALEESDHMRLAADIVHLPEVEPTLIPSSMVEPIDVPGIKKPVKRRILARLRRQRASSVSKLEGRRFSNEVDVYRKRLWNRRSFQSVEMLTKIVTSIKTWNDSTCLLMANATHRLPLMSQHKGTAGVQLASINFSGFSLEPYTTSSNLAGAASLGLRRRCNRATSEPPVPPNAHWNMSASKGKHFTNNTEKAKVRPDETSAVTKSQQKLLEATLVPHPPCKPQPENHRRRPQIRGVPLLMVCRN